MRRPAILLLLLLLSPGLARAAMVQVTGTVRSVDTGSGVITLSTNSGWQKVWVQNATDIERNGGRVDLFQLRQGDSVTVDGIPLNDGRILASRIRLSGGSSGGGGSSGSVTRMTPSPGSRITTTRPTVSATFDESISRGRIWIDGADFTGQAQVSGNTISWTPNYNLDNGEHTVRVEGFGVFGIAMPASWSFRIEPGGGGGAVQVTGYAPGPGTVVTVPQPTISAEFTGPVNRGTIRFYVDGRDFTPQVQVYGNRVSWTPRYTLDYGQHVARLEALTPGGQAVVGEWNFVISR